MTDPADRRVAVRGSTSSAAVAAGVRRRRCPASAATCVAFCVFLFGYTTLIGWAYYGEQFFEYILGRKVTVPYRWIYCLLIPFGAVSRVDLVWAWGDLMNALQMFPNLIGVLGLSGLVARSREQPPLRSAESDAAAHASRAVADSRRRTFRLLIAPSDRLLRSPPQSLASTCPFTDCRSLPMSSQTLPVITGDKDRSLQEALSRLTASRAPMGRDADPIVTAAHRLPADGGLVRAVSRRGPTTRLRGALAARGIEQLYTHQAEAFEHVLARPERRHHHADRVGQDALLQRAGPGRDSEGPVDARAVPVSDQGAGAGPARRAARAVARLVTRRDATREIGVFTYDGDTPSDARRAIRGKAHVVLSNPDMLHSGILPHHPRWAKLFENLQFVVIDELHAYRGVFGSHLVEHPAAAAAGLPALRVRSGLHLFVGDDRQPARARRRADRARRSSWSRRTARRAARSSSCSSIRRSSTRSSGIRRSYLAESRRVALEFLKHNLQLILFAQSRLAVEILTTYLKDAFHGPPGAADVIRGYRGGYLPNRRREIERGCARRRCARWCRPTRWSSASTSARSTSA